MTWKRTLRSLFIMSLLAGFGAAGWAASLELGQVRAKRRGWSDSDAASSQKATREMEAFADGESNLASEPVDEVDFAESVEAPVEEFSAEVPEAEPKAERALRAKRSLGSTKRRSGLILIGGGEKKKPSLENGYLTVDVPPALRFSDADPVNARPPSPALPEFNFVSSEYMPYLIETALTEDELNNAAMLSEIVIELAPHEVVSGRIETRSKVQEELVEHFDLDEQRTTVLRPEEVLIYFETDTNAGRTGTMVPFSPATPNTSTIKSSATLNKK